MSESAGDTGVDIPEAVATGGPARRLRDAVEPIAMHYVWGRLPQERLVEAGLDRLSAYIASRGAFLGQPSAAVVAATFAWFEPEIVGNAWDRACATVPRDQVVAVLDGGISESLGQALSGNDSSDFTDLLCDAVTAADGVGRPLFSGLRGRKRPTDPALRLWWACNCIREHRGDSHVIAATAAGIGPVDMNILTELWTGYPLFSYTATRGWPSPSMDEAGARLESLGWIADGALTENGLQTRRQIEATTDASEQQIVDVIGERLDALCLWLKGVEERLLPSCIFVGDSRKRAAG